MYTRKTKKRPRFPLIVRAMKLSEAFSSRVYIYKYKVNKAENIHKPITKHHKALHSNSETSCRASKHSVTETRRMRISYDPTSSQVVVIKIEKLSITMGSR